MNQNLYIAAIEPRSGKSLISLGIMELLARRFRQLRFFRPVIRAGDSRDNDIELIRRRYCEQQPYDAMYGVTHDQARQLIARGDQETLLKQVLERFKTLERTGEFVLCEGTDYTGLVSAFEFEFNAQVANHLGCDVVLIASGRQKSLEEVISVAQATRESFLDEGCTVAATMINRVCPDTLEPLRARLQEAWPHDDPIFVLPEQPILARPTVLQIARALGGRPISGTEAFRDREVFSCRVAAMHVTNFLKYIENGCLIITPGDRSDVILAGLAASHSDKYPEVAGMILTGGIEPSPEVTRLVEGFHRPPVPIFLVDTDTFATAMRVNEVHGLITPEADRKITTALEVFQSSVDAERLEERLAVPRAARMTPILFEYELVQRAKSDVQHIVLPEGSEERILRAVENLLIRGVVRLTLLGNVQEIRERAAALGVSLDGVQLVDPTDSEWSDEFARTYHELRKHKGLTEDYARDVMQDVSYFGTMMVYRGLADGMVSGAVHTTAHTIRPSFEIIRTRPGCSIVSSVFLMCLPDRVLVYGDCAVNPDPNPQQLADIAISSAETATLFHIEPRVAMLSYSTGESGTGADVEKVREATRIARRQRPDLKIVGPIQYDAAVDASVARTKMPDSDVAGRATVFIFPDLNTGNNTYKAVQRSAGAVAIGPVLQGLKRPVNDLSRGCTVTDIINTVAITAIQAQSAKDQL
jgi:phosphate acetyltransferase